MASTVLTVEIKPMPCFEADRLEWLAELLLHAERLAAYDLDGGDEFMWFDYPDTDFATKLAEALVVARGWIMDATPSPVLVEAHRTVLEVTRLRLHEIVGGIQLAIADRTRVLKRHIDGAHQAAGVLRYLRKLSDRQMHVERRKRSQRRHIKTNRR